MLMMSQYNSGP